MLHKFDEAAEEWIWWNAVQKRTDFRTFWVKDILYLRKTLCITLRVKKINIHIKLKTVTVVNVTTFF